MADVFATIVTPAAYQQDAIDLAQGQAAFQAGRTTDPNGAPPATHYLASGFLAEEIRDAFANDPRFVVSDQPWRAVCQSMGLFAIVS
jgi:hypothetical protein